MYFSFVDGTDGTFSPCSIYLGPDLLGVMELGTTVASAFGTATFPIPLPNDPLLEGATANCQAAEISAERHHRRRRESLERPQDPGRRPDQRLPVVATITV